MIYKIQADLIDNYPELKEKRCLIPYYVSLQFPERQRKIIGWWSSMIDAAIRHSKAVFISPSDLELIFTLHGLKPVPLAAVLSLLTKSDKFEWRDQPMNLHQKQDNLSFVSKILAMILPQKKITAKLTQSSSMQLDTNSKIVSTNFLREELQKMKRLIKLQLDLDNNISYNYILSQAKNDCQLNFKSLEFMVEQLGHKGWILIQKIGNNRLIIFSEDAAELNDPKWVEKQKRKFGLKLTINDFKNKAEVKLQEQTKKMQQAKKLVEKDKQGAKAALLQAKQIKQSREKLQTRIVALEKMNSDLELNQIDGKTLQALKSTQDLIKQTSIDSSILDNIHQNNDEIRMNQKQINNQFDELNNMNKDEDVDDEVNALMKQMERDVAITKRNKEKNAQKDDPLKKFAKNQDKYNAQEMANSFYI